MLQLITAEYLYKVRPEAAEGELTQQRSAMVNTNTLAQLSEELGVGGFLYLGKGILKGGGRSLKSLLANAFEAILGAVFLDAGYDAAYHFYLDRIRALPEPVSDENHKGRLQQAVQEKFALTPFYDSAAARGPGNRREYTAVVYAGADPLGTGHGPTKQAAEQEAARAALSSLAGAPQRRSQTAKTPPPALPPPEPAPVLDVAAEPAPDEPAAVETAPVPKPRRSRSRRAPRVAPEVTAAEAAPAEAPTLAGEAVPPAPPEPVRAPEPPPPQPEPAPEPPPPEPWRPRQFGELPPDTNAPTGSI